MADLKICRICLEMQCKIFHYSRSNLKIYYEEILGEKVTEKDLFPKYFCYECATMLVKWHKFKEKCFYGLMALKQIHWKSPITYETISKVDRKRRNLTSRLDIVKATLNRVHVKTYTFTHPYDEEESECDIEEVEENTGTNLKDNHNQQVSVDFKYEDEPPKEINEIYLMEEINDNLKNENDFNFMEENDVNSTDESDQDVMFVVGDINETGQIVKNVAIEEIQELDKVVPPSVTKKIKGRSKKRIPKTERGPNVSEAYMKNKIISEFKKSKVLDSSKWRIYMLSEEDAIKEFEQKADDTKYIQASFKCIKCFKWFSKEILLTRHNKLVHCEDLPMDCRFCHKRYKYSFQLRKHMSLHYARFRCLICNHIFCAESSALLHNDSHDKDATRKCNKCGKEFKHRSSYYTHLRIYHRSKFLCNLCGASFISQVGLQKHKNTVHIVKESENSEKPEKPEESNVFCEKCDITFENREAYETHFAHSVQHADEKDVKLRPLPMGICRGEKKVTLKSYSSTAKPTTCYQCGAHFKTQSACWKHLKSVHPGSSLFPGRCICEVCGASLAPNSIDAHRQLHDTKRLELPCKTCGKKFSRKMTLQRHQITHTGVKPFQCSLCDKKYTQKDSMLLHYKTVHLKQPHKPRIRKKKPPKSLTSEESY